MTVYEQLRRTSSESRVYRTSSNFHDELSWYAGHMMQKYPDTNWRECAQVIAGKPGKGVYDVEVNHMVEWGRSDARIIEDAFQVKLPESVHLFYRHITEAVFLWRKAYHFGSLGKKLGLERAFGRGIERG